jgi:hypothetical protein
MTTATNERFEVIPFYDLSERRKKLVQEAMALKSENSAKEAGWKKIGGGAYKRAYCKKNVVIKFGTKCDTEGMIYKSLPKKHKKYFARIYAYKADRCIQEFISGKYIPRGRYDELVKVLKQYHIIDFSYYKGQGHNVGCRKTVPVIFDYMQGF